VGCFFATVGYKPRSLFKKFIVLFDRSCINQKTNILEPGTTLQTPPIIAKWHYVDIFCTGVYPNPLRNTDSTGRKTFALLNKV
jgi:hypothetical protein